ncbi:hypothetical protein O5O45_29920 [Hahella aquimaris]|nr:hypothetical protein [Hahella sp. HNIBRBA332]WLQ13945.1 hypothetical protein O5O45_29920 [Hahella sp. HNIBRBA332]
MDQENEETKVNEEWETPDFTVMDANQAQGLVGDGADGGAGGDSRS